MLDKILDRAAKLPIFLTNVEEMEENIDVVSFNSLFNFFF